MSMVHHNRPGPEQPAKPDDGSPQPPVTVGCGRDHHRLSYALLLDARGGDGGIHLPGRAARRLWGHLAAPAASAGLGHLVLDEVRAQALLEALRGRVESAYGFAVREAELPEPWTGTFDGAEIVLLAALPPHVKSFILLHLFGHSVQWTAPSLAGSLAPLQSETDQERFLTALLAYESQAARFAMRLVQELGLERELGQWFADFVETDRRYVEDWYRHGKEKAPRPLERFLASGQPLVEPLDIPPITHRKVQLRFAF